MNKKILMVCQHYYPENFQVTDICEELVKRGYEVTALVGLPNYPEGYVLPEYKHNKNRTQDINGVHIIRCFEIGRRKGKFFLALNYLSFWFSSLLKVNSLPNNYDIVMGYETSPITMVDAARKYAKKHKKQFILFCADIWPECLKVYIKSENNPIYKFYKRISKKIYSSADKVLCTSTSFIDYLKEIHNIAENKLEYLPQFGDDSLLEEDFTPIDNGIFDLVFLGNVGQEQNLSAVIKALSKIREDNYIFHIVGDGSDLENVKQVVKELNIQKKVKFYGRRPKEEMRNFYRLADSCILSLRCNNKIGLTSPNKLQNYMAAGKPILGMISGSANRIINESRCGNCVNGNDCDLFTTIVENCFINSNCLKEYSKNSKKYYKNNFTKKIVMDKLEKSIFNEYLSA